MSYAGPGPLTPLAALTSWRLDPVVLAVVVLAGGAYGLAVRRVRARGEPWPRARVVLFLGVGLGSLVLATMSFLGVYQNVLFSVRAVQVIVLLMVTPLALASGAPVTLVLGDRGALHGRVARILTFPLVISALFIATPWLLYFTGWYPAVLTNPWLDQLTRLALITAGFLYFWTRLQLDPVPREYPFLLSLWITFVEVIFDAALGLTLWLGTHLVAADHYAALARPWGPSLRTDQILGAGAIWIIGDLAGLPFLIALVTRMRRTDEQLAAEIDRQLDEQAAAQQASPTTMRPWWETDPTLSERFRRH